MFEKVKVGGSGSYVDIIIKVVFVEVGMGLFIGFVLWLYVSGMGLSWYWDGGVLCVLVDELVVCGLRLL